MPVQQIERSIYLIRGQKVMLDRDLAELYGVETKALKQAVRRNAGRFPRDFAFVLEREEVATLRSQSVTSKTGDPRGGNRYAPIAFTEQGVAMLSCVLKSQQSVDVSIAIMRTFVKLRQLLESHAQLAAKLAEMEQQYDEQFRVVFEVLDELMSPPEPKRKQIGFGVREERAKYTAKRRKAKP
ncbi:MAG: ORF6N domain-containing protein [Verrucomicrobia bacterium]|nr:ORF6N domain-containing protein [Verrucomicrobiota bacterium]MBT7069139.1 ORF6N domain-containing protein [Verrucomicrobiota bacterium]MBT7699404.1 ORF6N domain-containing protein [Verrucomicrobiota bacterium]